MDADLSTSMPSFSPAAVRRGWAACPSRADVRRRHPVAPSGRRRRGCPGRRRRGSGLRGLPAGDPPLPRRTALRRSRGGHRRRARGTGETRRQPPPVDPGAGLRHAQCPAWRWRPFVRGPASRRARSADRTGWWLSPRMAAGSPWWAFIARPRYNVAWRSWPHGSLINGSVSALLASLDVQPVAVPAGSTA